MIIKKFLHSCILIEEEGKRLLIDPGVYSFMDGTLKPEDIGPVDVVLITHKHRDHYSAEALKTLYGLKPFVIIANPDVGEILMKDGFKYETIQAGQEGSVRGFMIEPLVAPHELIPTEVPHNTAYLINHRFLHAGDSITVSGIESCEVLALPVTAPWLKLIEAVEFAYRFQPKIAIPIHDWAIKDVMRDFLYNICKSKLEMRGIQFKPLNPGEALEI